MAKEKPWQVMLIAPVGTRDVTLTDLGLLPDEDLRQNWKHSNPELRIGARRKAEILLADLDRYAPALRLDILGKAVRQVFAQHGKIDRLILVASNQLDEKNTPERYRKNDTFGFANLIKELLSRDKKLHKVSGRIKIMTVTGNPASYETMRTFYRQGLPNWTRNLAPDGVCYLEVTGGTAQMGTMLLLEGVRCLRERAAPLYVMAEYETPLMLDVGRKMLADAMQQTLERDLSIYAYHAAWQSVTAEETILRPSIRYYDALEKVLKAAHHRLNFDFDAAQSALFGADQGLPAPLRRRVLTLAHELSLEGRSSEWLIAEVYHSAAIRRHNRAYASFVGRVFRFQEAMLRYLCEKWGARFGGKNDARLDPAWLAERPDVAQSLSKAKVNPKLIVNRRTLQVVANKLAHAGGHQKGLDWLKRLGKFEQIASLRNQLVITHGFEGVSAQRLSELYSGGSEQIETDMAALLVEVLDVDVSLNPYDAINDLCRELWQGEF